MRTSKDRPGFTLTELALVLFLLGFLFLLTFPSFRDLLEPRDIKKATVRLAGSLRYAQSQAVATKQRVRLYIDFKENAYWVSQEGGKDPFRPDFVPLGKPHSLPSGIVFLDVTHRERGKIREGTAYLEFSPTGWAEEGEIHLGRGEDEVFTLIVQPLGGKSEVAAGYVERRTF